MAIAYRWDTPDRQMLCLQINGRWTGDEIAQGYYELLQRAQAVRHPFAVAWSFDAQAWRSFPLADVIRSTGELGRVRHPSIKAQILVIEHMPEQYKFLLKQIAWLIPDVTDSPLALTMEDARRIAGERLKKS
jgi:hypothetical protein